VYIERAFIEKKKLNYAFTMPFPATSKFMWVSIRLRQKKRGGEEPQSTTEATDRGRNGAGSVQAGLGLVRGF